MDIQDNDRPQVEAPVTLLPDLSLWGIEEVERGVCEDSAENRKLLRENKSTWILVYTPDGRPTNLIQAVTPEMKEARLLANKSVLLTDPDNPDSDYLTGYDLIVESRADDVTPAWVLAATRQWNTIEAERERRGSDGKLYRPAIAGPPTRCRARRQDGKRCQNWMNGERDKDGLCKMHLSTKWNSDENIGPNMITRARLRLQSAAVIATEALEDMALNAQSEPTRVQAANSILDRVGVRGGIEIDQKVEISTAPADEIVRKRLEAIASRLEARAIEEAERRDREASAEAEKHDVEPQILEAVVIND